MVLTSMRRLGYLYGTPPLDNFISKLYYRWTVLLLIAFSFVITCKLWFGYSFICASSSVSEIFATIKCYSSSIYTVPKAIANKDESLAFRSVSEDEKRYADYYSWVNLLFLVHAFNFYLPHLLWKSYERGHIYRLTAGVQKYLDEEEKRNMKLCSLAKYVCGTQNKHTLYTLLYISSEILNFCISLCQTLWLVHFFNVTEVPDSTPFAISNRSDFQSFYFPTEGFCTFERLGASGDLQRHQVACQLPLNPLYMEMFLFLRGWYITITALTGFILVYRFILLIPSFREFITKISSPLSVPSIVKSVCHKLSYTDWFFLSRLQNAMTDIDFAQMLDKIAIVPQGRDPQSDSYRQFSALNDKMKDMDSSNATSAL